jgi:hypothetical protein
MSRKTNVHPGNRPLDELLEEELKKAKTSEDKIFVLGQYAVIIVDELHNRMSQEEQHNICVLLVHLFKESPVEVQKACASVLGRMKVNFCGDSIMALNIIYAYGKDESAKQAVVNAVTAS